MSNDDPLWQQIVADNVTTIPEGIDASDIKLPYYKPFKFQERTLCYVPTESACDGCVLHSIREETGIDDDEMLSCLHLPVCGEGHFENFTPEHYAQLVAREMNGVET